LVQDALSKGKKNPPAKKRKTDDKSFVLVEAGTENCDLKREIALFDCEMDDIKEEEEEDMSCDKCDENGCQDSFVNSILSASWDGLSLSQCEGELLDTGSKSDMPFEMEAIIAAEQQQWEQFLENGAGQESGNSGPGPIQCCGDENIENIEIPCEEGCEPECEEPVVVKSENVEMQVVKEEPVIPLPILKIVKQPGSKSFLKTSTRERLLFEVELRGDLSEFHTISCVKVFSTIKTLSLDNTPQELKDAKVVFELKFGSGIALGLNQIYFELIAVTKHGVHVTITSDFSDPFIIRTNISQYIRAEGMLLSKVAFQDKAKTLWHPHLSSALREQFYLTMGGTRRLSSEDLRYLHHKHLGGREEVPLNIFENFWEKWYGVIMRKLNEKKIVENYGRKE